MSASSPSRAQKCFPTKKGCLAHHQGMGATFFGTSKWGPFFLVKCKLNYSSSLYYKLAQPVSQTNAKHWLTTYQLTYLLTYLPANKLVLDDDEGTSAYLMKREQGVGDSIHPLLESPIAKRCEGIGRKQLHVVATNNGYNLWPDDRSACLL